MLWTSVFAESTVANDQNVHPSCCAILSPLTLLQKRHWCTTMVCRASAAAASASPQLGGMPGIDIATVATAGDPFSDAEAFSEQLGPEIGNCGAGGVAPSLLDLASHQTMFLGGKCGDDC
jgi:hypothetical protein